MFMELICLNLILVIPFLYLFISYHYFQYTLMFSFSPAYVFDALISYLRCCESDSNAHIDSGGAECTGFSWERDENENEDDIDDLPSITPSAGDSESTDEDSNLSNSRGRKHTFFQVSDRLLYVF